MARGRADTDIRNAAGRADRGVSFVLSPWAVRKSNDYPPQADGSEETAAVARDCWGGENDNRVYFIENFSGEQWFWRPISSCKRKSSRNSASSARTTARSSPTTTATVIYKCITADATKAGE